VKLAKTRVQNALSGARSSLSRCFGTTDPDQRAPSVPQVKATFDHKTGKVTAANLSVSSGVAELDACLLRVVRRITFEPLSVAGITSIAFKIPRGN
jgi:TonB family protein